jgi:hypothetical protein
MKLFWVGGIVEFEPLDPSAVSWSEWSAFLFRLVHFCNDFLLEHPKDTFGLARFINPYIHHRFDFAASVHNSRRYPKDYQNEIQVVTEAFDVLPYRDLQARLRVFA